MKVRYFVKDDAKEVLSWINSEREFRLWSADQYGDYPINPEDIVENYKSKISEGKFYPLIFEENGKTIGHMIIRYTGFDKDDYRLGFIIVNKKYRHKGYGQKIIFEAMKYAVKNFGARKYNLGVFTNNEDAMKCYESVGFTTTPIKKEISVYKNEKWEWVEMIYDPTQKIVDMAMNKIVKPF